MTLTIDHAPLSPSPPERVNYRIEGPKHRLLFEDFPRRVRAVLNGELIADTRDGKLLHESGHLPQLYIPVEDVRADLHVPSDHTTHCPFKGDASYWSIDMGNRVVENAVWAYPEPLEDATWLHGHVSIYWDRMDAWFDEDEEVKGHLRDPYHRVDVRATSRHVRVLADDRVIAETNRPKLLSETGLPNRYYIPPEDVERDLFEPSNTLTMLSLQGDRVLLVAARRRSPHRGCRVVVCRAPRKRAKGARSSLLLRRRHRSRGRWPPDQALGCSLAAGVSRRRPHHLNRQRSGNAGDVQNLGDY